MGSIYMRHHVSGRPSAARLIDTNGVVSVKVDCTCKVCPIRDGAWCGERSLSFARARSCLSQTDDGGTEVGIESPVTSSRATGQLLLRRVARSLRIHSIRQLADSGSRS